MTSAHASTGNDHLGSIGIGTDDEFAFANTKPPANFLDSVNFELGSPGAVVTDTLTSVFGIKTMAFTLYNDTTGTDVFHCAKECALTYSFADLTEGDDYSLIFRGKTRGNKDSSSLILGNLAVTSAVPEPDSWALCAAGLSLIGFAGWRRLRTLANHQGVSALTY